MFDHNMTSVPYIIAHILTMLTGEPAQHILVLQAGLHITAATRSCIRAHDPSSDNTL